MVRIARGWPAVWGAMLALSGCSPHAEPVPLEDLESQVAQAECTMLFRCCSAADRNARLPDTVTSERECMEQHATSGASYLGEAVAFALSTGRYEYDATATGACLAELRSCQVATCPFVTGIVADGGACDSATECVSHHCDEGTCAPPLGLGERCTLDGCGAQLACVEGICRQPRPDGEPCVTFHGCLSGTCDISGVCVPRNLCS